MNLNFLSILPLIQFICVIVSVFLSNKKFNEYKKMLEMLYHEIYNKSYRICGLKDFFLIGIPIKFFFSVDNNENSVLYLLRKKSRFYALVAFLSFQGFIITCFILLIIIE